MIWVTISKSRSFHLKTFPRATNTRGVSRMGQNWMLLRISKILITKNMSVPHLKKHNDQKEQRNKIWVTTSDPRIFQLNIFPRTRNAPVDLREGQKWHLSRILKILSTKIGLWRISKSSKIRGKNYMIWVTISNSRSFHMKVFPRATNTRPVPRGVQT